MKAITFTFLLLAVALNARADGNNLLENGDFSDGINHWYGGGRSPADFANDNPLAQSDPFTSQGLIIPLHSETWTKVAQDFKGKAASGDLTITFKVSNDIAFSQKPEDYTNVPDHIGYDHWKPFNIPPGEWMVFLSDFGSQHGFYTEIKPKLGSTDPQTYNLHVTGMTPFEDKTITLAFPPGSGTLVVLSVSLTSTP